MKPMDQSGEPPTLDVDDSPLSAAVTARDRDILSMVRNALSNGQTLLAFQPVQMCAGSQNIAFYEGLIRIGDPTGRVIPAREFMSTVEAHPLGRDIDVRALELGLAALRETKDTRISINLSARSIGYPAWIETLNRGLRSDPTIAERLILEITESSAMIMPDLVAVFMEQMQRRGIAFALDDFGAGYTSFRYLREFFFDILKIDGQFIRGISNDPDNQVLAKALISIGQHFDMFTVAESVERAEDAQFLAQSGVDCLQGYFIGAPTISPPWHIGRKRSA